MNNLAAKGVGNMAKAMDESLSDGAMRLYDLEGLDKSAYRAFFQSDVVLALGAGAFEFRALMDSLGDFDQSVQARVLCLHPFVDSRSTDIEQYQYEVGAELGVITLLLAALVGAHSQLPAVAMEFLKDLDIGHIASESALAEEELGNITHALQQAQSPMIFIGEGFLRHKYAQLICKVVAIIEMYSKIAFIPSLAGIMQCQKLDSSDVEQILQALNNIPESNGAFVYLSPFDEENLVAPVLYATKMFLRLLHLEQGEQARLIVDCAEVACAIKQVEYLKGATAVLKGWHTQRERFYPFITAQFAQNGGYNG